jgi:putative phosphoesterase
MRVALTGDTHMPKGARRLPDRCRELLAGSDLIVHVGDFSTRGFLDELRELGPPLEGVHGNVDDGWIRSSLPERAVLELEGIRLGLIHDAGPRQGRVGRMRRKFPDADAVIFGHSHLPLHEREAGFQIFNPGSPTERRRAPHRTMGIAEVSGRRLNLAHVILD